MIRRLHVLLLMCCGLGGLNAAAAEQGIPLPATLNGQIVGDLNAIVQGEQLQALDIAPIRASVRSLNCRF